MQRRPRLTLAKLFVLTTLAISVALGATFYASVESSRRSIVDRSDKLRDAAALRIGARLSADLGIGAAALADLERAMRFGVLSVDDPVPLEGDLFSELLDHPTLSDISLTHAVLLARDPDGSPRLAPDDRWQMSVFRVSADPQSEIATRRITLEDGRFVTDVRRRPPGAGLLAVPFRREPGATDPTRHPTFDTSVSQREYGKAIWSDLSFSELDSALPQSERRVVVTVQKAVEDSPGHFAGVLRVGLLARTIDELPLRSAGDSQSVFLCDREGLLVARVGRSDRLELMGDDLRVVPTDVPPPIAVALAHPALRELSRERPERSERLQVAGVTYLATFRALENSQDWLVGIVVPEDYYTRDLSALRDRFLFAFAAVTLIVLGAGGFMLQQLRRSLGRIVAMAGRMRAFNFAPSPIEAPFRDIADVMEGVERAKTSMRALGKYVPIDLVRALYEANREPELGGELIDLSLMFTDIEGFTSLSERLAPDELARALGRYFEAMTHGVRSTQGTVDKFIGDSVMAFWNAPTRCPDHALRACRSAIACMREARELYASPAWTGLPTLFTRFGLHKAKVMVGHFGAPERLSYTALGDGVNLASRLEGLCKHYGVAALASEAIVEEARGEFAFRFIDKVAVKGKHDSVRVYELLGVRDECLDALAAARPYELALEAYFARHFERALDLLRAREHDPPSRVLAARCEALLSNAPPQDWNGVYVATTK
jgi:adenylate cyclase